MAHRNCAWQQIIGMKTFQLSVSSTYEWMVRPRERYLENVSPLHHAAFVDRLEG